MAFFCPAVQRESREFSGYVENKCFIHCGNLPRYAHRQLFRNAAASRQELAVGVILVHQRSVRILRANLVRHFEHSRKPRRIDSGIGAAFRNAARTSSVAMFPTRLSPAKGSRQVPSVRRRTAGIPLRRPRESFLPHFPDGCASALQARCPQRDPLVRDTNHQQAVATRCQQCLRARPSRCDIFQPLKSLGDNLRPTARRKDCQTPSKCKLRGPDSPLPFPSATSRQASVIRLASCWHSPAGNMPNRIRIPIVVTPGVAKPAPTFFVTTIPIISGGSMVAPASWRQLSPWRHREGKC